MPLRDGSHVMGVFGQVKDIAEDSTPAAPDSRLTPRQSEVLRLLERGYSTDQIGRELHLSTETVRNHVRAVLQALNVHSRLEAVALSRRVHA